MTPMVDDETRNGSMPISWSRVKATAALLVWSVVNTRWPVSAASTAVCAVSRSRVSPTSMTSGSCRRNARRIAANVSPMAAFAWICVTPGRSYSIGSSAVEMLTPGSLISASAEYSVVVFPDPVGPVT